MTTKKSTYLLIFNLFQTQLTDYRQVMKGITTFRGGLEIEGNENSFRSFCGFGAAK